MKKILTIFLFLINAFVNESNQHIGCCNDNFDNVCGNLYNCSVCENVNLLAENALSKDSTANRSSRKYLNWIAQEYPGYVGIWPPTRTVTLGSIGSLDEKGFTQYTTVEVQQHQKSNNAQLSMLYCATIERDTSQKHALKISFSNYEGFIVQASGLSSMTAADLTKIKSTVEKKLQNKDWNPNWYVIIEVQVASVATIIISEEEGTELILDGTVGTPLALANDAKLNIYSTKGSTITFLTFKYPVLMYRALKLSDVSKLDLSHCPNS